MIDGLTLTTGDNLNARHMWGRWREIKRCAVPHKAGRLLSLAGVPGGPMQPRRLHLARDGPGPAVGSISLHMRHVLTTPTITTPFPVSITSRVHAYSTASLVFHPWDFVSSNGRVKQCINPGCFEQGRARMMQ